MNILFSLKEILKFWLRLEFPLTTAFNSSPFCVSKHTYKLGVYPYRHLYIKIKPVEIVLHCITLHICFKFFLIKHILL